MAGDTDFVMARSADWPIDVATVTLLFAVFGSVTAELTDAVLVSVVPMKPEPTTRTNVADIVWPGASAATVHSTLPPSGAQVPSVEVIGVAASSVVPSGIASVRRTVVAVDGPLLVAPIV